MRLGDPSENVPGQSIIIPERPEQIRAKDLDLARLRRSYVRNALAHAGEGYAPTAEDIEFLAADAHTTPDAVEAILAGLKEA